MSKENILKFHFDRDIFGIGISTEFNENGEIENIKEIIKAEDVTDLKWTRFVADPFLFKKDNIYYIFFEIYDNMSDKGVIGYSYSEDKLNWKYGKVVLEEEYHLSYPYIFEEDGEIYMIPEGGAGGSVKLYKTKNFPEDWEVQSVLIDKPYWDPSYVKKDGVHYMFLLDNDFSGNSDYTRLYYSDSLKKGWKEHPCSPILSKNTHITRPGGRVIKNNGKFFRYVQDCYDYYGENVREFEIIELTKETYKEKEVRIILNKDNKKGSWKEHGMHNIDYLNENGKYLIVADGLKIISVNRYLERIKEKLRGKN
ncbi:MAG: glucosamine inositolphosphorylceramide transferase family protein [Sarcina sp.]